MRSDEERERTSQDRTPSRRVRDFYVYGDGNIYVRRIGRLTEAGTNRQVALLACVGTIIASLTPHHLSAV